jgi:hypothetical protein
MKRNVSARKNTLKLDLGQIRKMSCLAERQPVLLEQGHRKL